MTPLYFHKGVEGLLLGAKPGAGIPHELRAYSAWKSVSRRKNSLRGGAFQRPGSLVRGSPLAA